MTTAVGMPAEFVWPMRGMPMFPALEASAHILAYDGTVVGPCHAVCCNSTSCT